MSTGAIIGLLVAIVVIGAIAVIVNQERRRARLRRQFGPEYKQLTDDLGSSRKAEAELMARQRRASKLEIRPLSDEQRIQYTADWTKVQEQFVDSPTSALSSARGLLSRMMRETGYPEDQGDTVMAISVHNSRALDDYRQAQAIGDNGRKASTEELREALIRYRTLFDDLVGETRSDTPEPNDPPAQRKGKLASSLTPASRQED
ncbi:MAG TPA: hypothetical protein VGG16_06000 [Streptosporangiaceae bacterium]|jgi:hypothetical protein